MAVKKLSFTNLKLICLFGPVKSDVYFHLGLPSMKAINDL